MGLLSFLGLGGSSDDATDTESSTAEKSTTVASGGADPVSAIANAVGGIFDFFSLGKKKDLAKQENANLKQQGSNDQVLGQYNNQSKELDLVLQKQATQKADQKVLEYIIIAMIAFVFLVIVVVLAKNKNKT